MNPFLSGAAARVLVLALAASVLAVPAPAQDAPGGGNPCDDLYRRFCSQVRPGGGRIVACVREHEAEATEACRAFLAAARPAPARGGDAGAFLGLSGNGGNSSCPPPRNAF